MSAIPNDCMICNSTFLTTMPIKEVSFLIWDETVASKWFYMDTSIKTPEVIFETIKDRISLISL